MHRLQFGRSFRCVETSEHVARAHRVNFRCPSRERDVMRVQLVDALASTHHNRRAVEHSDHVVAVVRVEYEHVVAGGTCLGSRTRTADPIADDDVIGAAMTHCDVRVVLRPTRRRMADLGVATHDRSAASGCLAGAHPRNTVDDRNTVAAIPCETQGPSSRRMLTIAQSGNGQRVAVDKLDRRPVVNNPTHRAFALNADPSMTRQYQHTCPRKEGAARRQRSRVCVAA